MSMFLLIIFDIYPQIMFSANILNVQIYFAFKIGNTNMYQPRLEYPPTLSLHTYVVCI